MITWSINAALSSGLFDHVIVSTDDEEIAAIAKTYGADVPFMRPDALSDDYTGTSAVVAHAIDWHVSHGIMPEPVCCIYATAPFVTANDLKLGWQTMNDTDADFAFTVTSYAFPIQRAIKLNKAGRVEMFQPEHFNSRSQDLEAAFHDAGQFYWGRAKAWCSGKELFGTDSVPLILPRHRVQDIDTPEDWKRAEWMFKALQETGGIC
jgi:N-acylneuraminate cytidylyltransferase